MPERDQRRFHEVDGQRNDVRYDTPIIEWRAFRFAAAGAAALYRRWERSVEVVVFG